MTSKGKITGENPCVKFRKLISVYADNEANLFENETLSDHAATCPSCKREIANIYAMKDMIKSVYAPKEKVDFSSSIMQRINSGTQSVAARKNVKKEGFGSGILKYGAVAALIFIALGATVWYSQNQTQKVLASEKRKFDTYVVEHSAHAADEGDIAQVIAVSFEK